MEDQLNGQSAQTSTGSNWFSSLITGAVSAYGANQAAHTAAAGQPPPTAAAAPTNWKLIGGIGAGVLLLIIVLFAVKK